MVAPPPTVACQRLGLHPDYVRAKWWLYHQNCFFIFLQLPQCSLLFPRSLIFSCFQEENTSQALLKKGSIIPCDYSIVMATVITRHWCSITFNVMNLWAFATFTFTLEAHTPEEIKHNKNIFSLVLQACMQKWPTISKCAATYRLFSVILGNCWVDSGISSGNSCVGRNVLSPNYHQI